MIFLHQRPHSATTQTVCICSSPSVSSNEFINNSGMDVDMLSFSPPSTLTPISPEPLQTSPETPAAIQSDSVTETLVTVLERQCYNFQSLCTCQGHAHTPTGQQSGNVGIVIQEWAPGVGHLIDTELAKYTFVSRQQVICLETSFSARGVVVRRRLTDCMCINIADDSAKFAHHCFGLSEGETKACQTCLPSWSQDWSVDCFDHLTTVSENRKCGVEKACATREAKKKQRCFCKVCGKEYTDVTDEPEYWIQCEKRLFWYHWDCVRVLTEPDTFTCFLCTPNIVNLIIECTNWWIELSMQIDD